MPRSPRAQSLLLAAFTGLLLVTGAAFVSTFGSQLTWQQRDAVDVSVDEYAVHDGETPTVTVRLTVTNPLDRPVEVSDSELVVFEGGEPHVEGARLTTPRTSSVPDTTVPAGGERTVTATMDVAEGGTERARAAVDGGSATVSGVLRVRLLGREFSVDV